MTAPHSHAIVGAAAAPAAAVPTAIPWWHDPAVAAWVGAGAAVIAALATTGTLATSIVAVIGGGKQIAHAQRQLTAYLANERLARTFRIYDDFFIAHAPNLSPMAAFDQLELIRNRGLNAAFHSKETPLQKHDAVFAWLQVVHNYFDNASTLIKANLIDRDYFFDRFQRIIPALNEVVEFHVKMLYKPDADAPASASAAAITQQLEAWKAVRAKRAGERLPPTSPTVLDRLDRAAIARRGTAAFGGAHFPINPRRSNGDGPSAVAVTALQTAERHRSANSPCAFKPDHPEGPGGTLPGLLDHPALRARARSFSWRRSSPPAPLLFRERGRTAPASPIASAPPNS